MVYGVTWLLYTHTIEGGDSKFNLITFELCFEVIKENREEGARIVNAMRTVPNLLLHEVGHIYDFSEF
jgi:hypothetical protein